MNGYLAGINEHSLSLHPSKSNDTLQFGNLKVAEPQKNYRKIPPSASLIAKYMILQEISRPLVLTSVIGMAVDALLHFVLVYHFKFGVM